MKPFWVTFYSYKGGVGRSLALANTAALLVKRGRRVLLIDFDLEAPGLDSFAEFAPAAGKPGVVEYVSEFVRHKAAPDIRPYVHRCELPGPLRGQLCVMPAGRRDAAYNHQLTHINWADLYESGFGTPFFANWKAAIDHHFQPDYVFVDSRTGLTEVGGVCTTQFPDLVVMLFGLNQQNIRGIATVAQSIRDADPDRIPQLHHVATPVPNLLPDTRSQGSTQNPSRKSLVQERLDAASEVLGVKITSTIRYYAPACLQEKLFVLENDGAQQPVTADYEELCGQITGFNRMGLDFLITQSSLALSEGNLERNNRLSAILTRDFSDRPEALFLQSRFAMARGDVDTAVELAAQALELDPAHSDSRNFLVGHFTRHRSWEKVSEIYDRVLANGHLLSAETLDEVRRDSAHVLMTLGRPSAAAERYAACRRRSEENAEPPGLLLVDVFNQTEAERRATGTIECDSWKKVIELFERAGEGTDSSPPNQANQWQAVHIAFALLGDHKRAVEAVKKARRASELVGEAEDIFSVKTYCTVSVSEFREINDEMLAALGRGELWDGMKLPAATF